jgi:hypothetical protein
MVHVGVIQVVAVSTIDVAIAAVLMGEIFFQWISIAIRLHSRLGILFCCHFEQCC